MSQQFFPNTIPNINIDPTFVALAASRAVEVDLLSGAIAVKSGNVFLTKAGVAVMTLALPIAGTPDASGDDGKTLTIISTTANAHTVTTPANGIDGSLHIATFSGTLPNVLELKAYQGVWYSVIKLGITNS